MECHLEKIHLCGKIQDFGYLFVFENNICIAASENQAEIIEVGIEGVFGLELSVALKLLIPDNILNINEINDYISHADKRFVEYIKIKEQKYSISIYKYEGKTFIEIERCNEYCLKSTSLNNYARLFEESTDSWQVLTSLIRKVTGFDRAMVYMFLEDSSGQVIAESKNEELTSFLSYRYPEFDIPVQARELYTRFLSRSVENIDGALHNILGAFPDQLDLSYCGIRALSPIHLEYLRNAGVYASASFSIIIEGKLWGLVTCQNIMPKHVDLEQRSTCSFLIQYAINFYLLNCQRELTGNHKILGVLERDLKAEILVNYDFHNVVEKYALHLKEIVLADGIAVRHNDNLTFIEDTPGKIGIEIIDTFLSKGDKEILFSTDKFDYNLSKIPDQIGFPGVVRINLLPGHQWFLYLFRKENIVEEIWAGKPEKGSFKNRGGRSFYPSPRSSFEKWKQMSKGKSAPWKIKEIAFLERIVNVIQQAIAQRGGEIFNLNKELIRSNNALDTFGYTLTHDLKNPLAMIKLSADMMMKREKDKNSIMYKLANNIIDSSKLMTEMMDRINELSQSNYINFEFEMINPQKMIIEILENCKKQYGNEKLKFILGDTITIPAERTLLYQMFLNLIGNAVKYSSKKKNPVVEIRSYRENLSVVYEIRDNGIGIDLSNGANIFNIFSRMPNTKNFEGIGIGLSIVKRIADRLGARILVDSEINIGTHFKIEFMDVPL
nr:ATP-binding protein [uncultured Chryseobacterium sp.]